MAKVAREGASRAVAGRGRGVEGGRGSAGRAVTPDTPRSEHPQSKQRLQRTEHHGLTIKLDDGVTSAWRWTCLLVEEEEEEEEEEGM